jgi:hypothetical protein
MPYLKIYGLSPKIRKKFNRALDLAGAGSQSQWLLTMINRFIRQAEIKHGDLLLALTAEEQWVVEVIASGAAEPEQIAQETGFEMAVAMRVLADLVERDILEIRRQGGKTEQARGARRPLYFVSPKYQSKLD